MSSSDNFAFSRIQAESVERSRRTLIVVEELRRALASQTERADHLLKRKDELYALLVRVALCRELVAELPADLQADLRAVVGDLVQ